MLGYFVYFAVLYIKGIEVHHNKDNRVFQLLKTTNKGENRKNGQAQDLGLGYEVMISRLLTHRQLRVTVDLEPVCADQVLLVKHRVVGAEEVEILKLKK